MKASDVGLILLNSQLTIATYPSMTWKFPILAATDTVIDLKSLIEDEAKCGYWCESVNHEECVNQVKLFIEDKNLWDSLGNNGRDYLVKQFDVKISVKLI